MKTWSPTWSGKNATLKQEQPIIRIKLYKRSKGNNHPLANFLKGGRITECLLRMQYWPIRTFAKSPLIMLSPMMIFLPLRTIFCEPHSTDCLLTLLPVCCTTTGLIRQLNQMKPTFTIPFVHILYSRNRYQLTPWLTPNNKGNWLFRFRISFTLERGFETSSDVFSQIFNWTAKYFT